MENDEIVKELSDLTQLDIDAVHAYDEAIKNITDDDIRKNISDFRDDHKRHIDDLSKLIRKYDGEPPEFTKDFKGYLIQGFTSLRSITGTEGALKAMESNEILTNKNYKTALEESGNFPPDVKELIQKNYFDEKRHLEYIRQVIAQFKK